MQIGINLRGDLAKLDDAEIASRFEALISEMETKHKVAYEVGKFSARGLLHAQIFYRIQAVIFGVLLALPPNGAWMGISDIERYLLACELSDVRDEIARRVKYRKKAMSAI
jgi:hypothetical protein